MEDHQPAVRVAGVGGARCAWVGTSRATNFFIMKKGYKQVNEKDF